jgi:DNA-binding transcriptional ArsR family regulator
MGDAALKSALFEQLARVGRALASGKRLELLDLLAQAERPVDALATAAGLNLTTASAHLQSLKQAGLVATRRDGTKIYYRLAGPDVADLIVRARQRRRGPPAGCRRRARPLPGPRRRPSRSIGTSCCAASRRVRRSCWTCAPPGSSRRATCRGR